MGGGGIDMSKMNAFASSMASLRSGGRREIWLLSDLLRGTWEGGGPMKMALSVLKRLIGSSTVNSKLMAMRIASCCLMMASLTSFKVNKASKLDDLSAMRTYAGAKHVGRRFDKDFRTGQSVVKFGR